MHKAVLLLAIGAGLCSAETVYDNAFHKAESCSYSYTAPYTGCDVIGTQANYDIEKATLDIAGGLVTATLYFDSAAVTGSLHAQTFSDAGFTLALGDVFFYSLRSDGASDGQIVDPADPDKYAASLGYGVPLASHGVFTAGGLYEIDGSSVSTDNASEVISGSGYYRRDLPVWLAKGQGAVTKEAQGTVSFALNNQGSNHAKYAVTVIFPATSGFLSLVDKGKLGILFSSADCGNDFIDAAAVVPTPEPSAGLLLSLGVGMLAAGISLRRKRV